MFKDPPRSPGPRAIAFTVSAAGRQPFSCTIFPDEHRIESVLPPGIGTFDPSTIPGQACSCTRTGRCELLDILLPILRYFSTMTSHETVTVEHEEQDIYGRYSRSAQEACFILCTHAMIHSACHFFGKYSALFEHYRMDLSADTMMQYFLTTTLLRRHLSKQTDAGPGLGQSMLDRAQDVHGRLLRILAEARGLPGQDAALNAVNRMFNLHQLSLTQLDEYAAEIGRRMHML
jgi:hypothetical protein